MTLSTMRSVILYIRCLRQPRSEAYRPPSQLSSPIVTTGPVNSLNVSILNLWHQQYHPNVSRPTRLTLSVFFELVETQNHQASTSPIDTIAQHPKTLQSHDSRMKSWYNKSHEAEDYRESMAETNLSDIQY